MRFAEGLSNLVARGDVLLLEVGPGRTLADLTRHGRVDGRPAAVYSSLGREGNDASDQRVLLESLAQLWVDGAPIDWRGFYAHEQRRRVQLPTYPFQRQALLDRSSIGVGAAARSDARLCTSRVARPAAAGALVVSATHAAHAVRGCHDQISK